MTNTEIYNTRSWRNLPRNGLCAVAELLGLENQCSGPLHRHHVHPLSEGGDPLGRTTLVCEKHHPTLEKLGREFRHPHWKPCPHKPGTHRYPGAKESCERLLNRELVSV